MRDLVKFQTANPWTYEDLPEVWSIADKPTPEDIHTEGKQIVSKEIEKDDRDDGPSEPRFDRHEA